MSSQSSSTSVVFLFALIIPEYMIFGLSIPLIIMVFSRMLDGVTGGNNSVANAYVSDITTPEEKKYIFGYLGAISGIGFIIGPGLGGWASGLTEGFEGTILAAITLSFLTLLSLLFLLKESHPKEKRTPKQKHSFKEAIQITKRIKHAKPSKFINRLFLLKFIFSIMMAFYIATIALFIKDLFNYSAVELGHFMLFAGSFLVFNQAVMSKLFIKKFGAFNTLIIGMSLTTIGLFCLTISSDLITYLSFYYILNLGLALSFNTFNTLIALNADPHHQGEIMGISESISSFCNAIFPVIGAALYGMYSYNIYYFIAALPFTALLIALKSKQEHIE